MRKSLLLLYVSRYVLYYTRYRCVFNGKPTEESQPPSSSFVTCTSNVLRFIDKNLKVSKFQILKLDGNTPPHTPSYIYIDFQKF